MQQKRTQERPENTTEEAWQKGLERSRDTGETHADARHLRKTKLKIAVHDRCSAERVQRGVWGERVTVIGSEWPS